MKHISYDPNRGRRFLPAWPVFLSLALTIAGLLTALSLEAKHIIGGEMTYRYLQDVGLYKQYEFTLIIYRDCDSGGGSLDNPASIGIFLGDLNGALLINDTTVNLQTIEFVDPVIPPCADVSSVSNACVQRGVYVFRLTLAPLAADESYFIVYQRCCRTDQILNILTPDAFGATYMVELSPQTLALNNSSPIFTNYPPTFICNSLPINFDHSATDVDGDSLVYEFCTPLTGGGNAGTNNCDGPQPSPPCGPPFDTVIFIPPYSEINPMGGDPVIGVDSATGLLSGTPYFLGQFVVGICVKEYRNGQLIGMILRDFQFNVVDCTSSVIAEVAADAILGPKNFLIKRCGQKTITILNQSPQSGDLSAWEWEFDLNGTPYTSSAWNLTMVIPDYGEYFGRLYLNRNLMCEDTAFITLRAFPGVDAEFSQSWDICAETPVAFADSSVSGAAAGIMSWDWDFGPQVAGSTQQHPVVTFPEYGNYPVRLVVTDADGCTDELLRNVTWIPQLPPVITPPPFQLLCENEPAVFSVFDTTDLTDASIVWNFGDGKFANDEIETSHLYKPGTYTVSVAVTTAFDCFVTDTFFNAVELVAAPIADFSYQPEALSNLNNTVLFTDLSDNSVVFWSWQFGNFGTSHDPNPLYTFPDTGLVPVVLAVSNPKGCVDTLTQILDLVPKVQLYIPNAFAPESDSGLGNERFGMLGILPGYSNYKLNIWSRWGELLFESTNPQEGWDGRRMGNNKILPKGVYVYSIKFTGPRGEPFTFEGSVTLL